MATENNVQAPSADLQRRVENLKALGGLEVDLNGSWIWVWGDTWKHRDILSMMGFKYSRKRRKMYYAPPNQKKRFRRAANISYQRIQEIHGSRKVRRKEDEE